MNKKIFWGIMLLLVIGIPLRNIIHDIIVVHEVKSTLQYLKDFSVQHHRYPVESEFNEYVLSKKNLVDPKYKNYSTNISLQYFKFSYILNSSFVRKSAPGTVGRELGFYGRNYIDSCDIDRICGFGSDGDAFAEVRHLVQLTTYGDSSQIFSKPNAAKYFLSKGQALVFNNTAGCSNCDKEKFSLVDYDSTFFVETDIVPNGVFKILKSVHAGDTIVHARICIVSNDGTCFTYVDYPIQVNVKDELDSNTPRFEWIVNL